LITYVGPVAPEIATPFKNHWKVPAEATRAGGDLPNVAMLRVGWLTPIADVDEPPTEAPTERTIVLLSFTVWSDGCWVIAGADPPVPSVKAQGLLATVP
jgi:hypothetical protein